MSIVSVKTGISSHPDTAQAVAELANAIAQPAPSVVIFFASSRYDLEVLAPALEQTFDCPVLGCTSAGEFVRGKGYCKGSIVAASIQSDALVVHPHLITPLSMFSLTEAGMIASSFAARVQGGCLLPESMFALLFADGLQMMEERLISGLQGAFGSVPVVGGSAGDDMQFVQTSVYYGGAFHSDAALVALFETSLPFSIFQTQHFIRSDRRLQITLASPERRTVHTIDNRRASEVYAEVIGVAESELDDALFSRHPLILRLGGRNYIRALRKAYPDGSLEFNGAIDQGLSIYLGTGNDIVANLENALYESRNDVPNPRLLIGCECAHRRLEVEASGLTDRVQKVLDTVEHVGFHTYGEQVDGVHVNHTFTGVIIGE